MRAWYQEWTAEGVSPWGPGSNWGWRCGWGPMEMGMGCGFMATWVNESLIRP